MGDILLKAGCSGVGGGWKGGVSVSTILTEGRVGRAYVHTASMYYIILDSILYGVAIAPALRHINPQRVNESLAYRVGGPNAQLLQIRGTLYAKPKRAP